MAANFAQGNSYNKKLLFAAFAAIVTFIVYIPALSNGFVSFDDPAYVFNNPYILSLDGKLIRWAFTSTELNNFHPLTVISLAIDHAIFGPGPWGFHFVNNLLHSINTFLVFLVCHRLVSTRTDERATQIIAPLVTALLFGLHPMHVESVAWISERKDVLYALFYLLSVLSYIGFVARKNKNLYIASLILALLSLLSKPMAVTLPLVLLLIDYYPLERFKSESVKKLVIEKLPFFALCLAAGLATIWAQGVSGAIKADIFPFGLRLLVALRAFAFYIFKFIFPSGLSPFYPYPEFSASTLEFAAAIIFVIMISILAYLLSKRVKALGTLWLYYIITLLPVVGIIQVGAQAAGDRYTYLPSLGPFILAGLVVAGIIKRSSEGRRYVFTGMALAVFIALSLGTLKQIKVWQSSFALWGHVIALYPDSVPGPYYNRGIDYMLEGKLAEAERDFTRAIEINPEHTGSYLNRGTVLRRSGKVNAAITDFNMVIALDPKNASAFNNRGVAYATLHNIDAAIIDFKRAVELEPELRSAYNNLSHAYSVLGDTNKAILYQIKAERLKGR